MFADISVLTSGRWDVAVAGRIQHTHVDAAEQVNHSPFVTACMLLLEKALHVAAECHCLHVTDLEMEQCRTSRRLLLHTAGAPGMSLQIPYTDASVRVYVHACVHASFHACKHLHFVHASAYMWESARAPPTTPAPCPSPPPLPAPPPSPPAHSFSLPLPAAHPARGHGTRRCELPGCVGCLSEGSCVRANRQQAEEGKCVSFVVVLPAAVS